MALIGMEISLLVHKKLKVYIIIYDIILISINVYFFLLVANPVMFQLQIGPNSDCTCWSVSERIL